jgi:archaellum biogenesis protein FlaJ (TadC family)
MLKPGESRDEKEPPMRTTPTRRRSWLRRVFKIAFALAALVGVAMIGLPPVVQGVIVGALTVFALSQPPMTTTPARRRSWLRRVFNIALALALLAGVAMIVIPHDGLPPGFQGVIVGGLAVIVVRRLWREGDK